ncbi:uncharacterized protein TNCV_188871 [Trichonephila clavipes]|nr:uncharacterized protein TNCV_188871 [Trichonephila clavipes]
MYIKPNHLYGNWFSTKISVRKSVLHKRINRHANRTHYTAFLRQCFTIFYVAAVAEWYRYRTVACLVTSSSPVPLKTRRVGQQCTLNMSRAQTSSRWCGVVVRRGGASSGVVHVT